MTDTPSSTPRGIDASRGIDPRGPRFTAGITAVLMLVVVALGLAAPVGADVAARILEPGFLLLTALMLLFAYGAIAGVARHPFGRLFRAVVRPRLSPPTELENPAPPRFAQGVGLVVTALGVVLHLVGVPFAVPVAGAAAFIAAFLNSAFGYCLGCELYLLLVRAGIVGRSGGRTA
ncbi:DUF4395 domain-containing protein [Microbacteriaceae bacterium VKM Ac-2855]|nr:DUF4395 domain-containing protein [Microbacteriaceae bacterium VKM Ac-2855]